MHYNVTGITQNLNLFKVYYVFIVAKKISYCKSIINFYYIYKYNLILNKCRSKSNF
jgi:hypothetical protein